MALEYEQLRGGNRLVLVVVGNKDNGFGKKQQFDAVLKSFSLWRRRGLWLIRLARKRLLKGLKESLLQHGDPTHKGIVLECRSAELGSIVVKRKETATSDLRKSS